MKPSFETIKAVNAVLALTKDELEEFAYRVHHVSPSKALRIELFPELPPDAADALAPRQLAPIFQFWTSEWKSPPGTDGTESAFLAGWSGAKRGVFLTDEIKEGLGRFKSRGKRGAAGESQDRTPAGKRATGHGDRVR